MSCQIIASHAGQTDIDDRSGIVMLSIDSRTAAALEKY